MKNVNEIMKKTQTTIVGIITVLMLTILLSACGISPDNNSLNQIQSANTTTISEKIEGGWFLIESTFYNGSLKPFDANIYLNFQITNKCNLPAELSKIKVRYYFTQEGEQSLNFMPDYAGGRPVPGEYKTLTPYLTGSFTKMEPATTHADHYLEISFDPEAGNLMPNGVIWFKVRIGKSDWSPFDQSNDFSFCPETTGFAPLTFVTAYYQDRPTLGRDPYEADRDY